MARGRMLNRTVATSGKVAAYGEEMGAYALVFHHRIIAFLDMNGNVKADPYWLKGEIMPRVSGCSPEDCRKYAGGLSRHGLAVAYEVDGMPYLHFPGFREHQVGLRADRERPDVPVPQGFDESTGEFPESFRKVSGKAPEGVPPEVEVEVEVEPEVEVKSLVRENADDAPQTDLATVQEIHEHFCQTRGGRPLKLTTDRKAKYRARLRTYSPEEICTAIDNALADPFYRGENDQNTRYDFPETILKNDAAVDRHLHRGRNGNDSFMRKAARTRRALD